MEKWGVASVMKGEPANVLDPQVSPATTIDHLRSRQHPSRASRPRRSSVLPSLSLPTPSLTHSAAPLCHWNCKPPPFLPSSPPFSSLGRTRLGLTSTSLTADPPRPGPSPRTSPSCDARGEEICCCPNELSLKSQRSKKPDGFVSLRLQLPLYISLSASKDTTLNLGASVTNVFCPHLGSYTRALIISFGQAQFLDYNKHT